MQVLTQACRTAKHARSHSDHTSCDRRTGRSVVARVTLLVLTAQRFSMASTVSLLLSSHESTAQSKQRKREKAPPPLKSPRRQRAKPLNAELRRAKEGSLLERRPAGGEVPVHSAALHAMDIFSTHHVRPFCIVLYMQTSSNYGSIVQNKLRLHNIVQNTSG